MSCLRSITAASCVSLLLIAVMVRGEAEDTLPMNQQSLGSIAPLASSGSSTPRLETTGDLREDFAIAVQERNLIRHERDVLRSQKWFVVFYAALVSAFAMWLGRHLLRRSPMERSNGTPATTTKVYAAVNARASAAATATAAANARTTQVMRNAPRKNATITIRNSQTQLPEVIDKVATRRFFSSPVDAPIKPALMSQTLAEQLGSSAPSLPATEPDVVDDYAPTTSVAAHATTTIVASRQAQVPAQRPSFTTDPQSDYFGSEQQIAHYQSVFAAPRVKGFSLLEITISVAVLATVLMAVGSGMMSLNTSQKITREDAAVHELMHLYAERIMGGEWEWLGRDRDDGSTYRGAWSWQREQSSDPKLIPLHPPLRENATDPLNQLSHQLLDEQKSGVDNLSLYLEYYQSDAVTASFTPVAGTSANKSWQEARLANRMPVPIDLRGYNDAVVVRIAATWDSQGGGPRSHELVFARRR